mgnify:CR=1 FL=1
MEILPIILAALAIFVIGFLFHGPLFGKLWMKLADIHPTGNEKFKDMIFTLKKSLQLYFSHRAKHLSH